MSIVLAVVLIPLALAAGPRLPPHLPQAPTSAEGLRGQVRTLEGRVASRPSDASAWKALAMAWRRLARLTGDPACDEKAWEAITAALEANPKDAETLALKGWIEAARHDFEGAVLSARAAIAARPEDAFGYGVLADALTELGRYPEAVSAVEQMMRRKPGAPAYSRAAHLRGLHGDREGAIRLMKMAVEAESAGDPEGLAWSLVMLGLEYQKGGDHTSARTQYQRALAVVPDYHLALFHRASSLAATGEIDAARAIVERLQVLTPSVASAALLADLLSASGEGEKAREVSRTVDAVAALEDPSKAEPRWLARFYADQGRRLEESIALVRKELATHQDIETWDGLAWALHQAGRHEEALAASEKALALGTIDARLMYHRGMIELGLGRTSEGRLWLERSIAVNDLWPGERAGARQALSRLVKKAVP